MATGHYDNIRQVLGGLIGKTVVDITQHDADEWEQTKASYIQFHFDNGDYVRIYVGDEGFQHSCEEESDDAQTG